MLKCFGTRERCRPRSCGMLRHVADPRPCPSVSRCAHARRAGGRRGPRYRSHPHAPRPHYLRANVPLPRLARGLPRERTRRGRGRRARARGPRRRRRACGRRQPAETGRTETDQSNCRWRKGCRGHDDRGTPVSSQAWLPRRRRLLGGHRDRAGVDGHRAVGVRAGEEAALDGRPVSTVIVTAARMFPLKIVVVSRVADVPTCQKTFPAFAAGEDHLHAPRAGREGRSHLEDEDRVGVALRVERVTLLPGPDPWIRTDVEFVYRPGVNVSPPMLPGRLCDVTERPVASLYARAGRTRPSMIAWSVTWIVPFTWAGGTPWALAGVEADVAVDLRGGGAADRRGGHHRERAGRPKVDPFLRDLRAGRERPDLVARQRVAGEVRRRSTCRRRSWRCRWCRGREDWPTASSSMPVSASYFTVPATAARWARPASRWRR